MKKYLSLLLILIISLTNLTLANLVKTDVLIVGAGPSGLVLANILDEKNIQYIIIDKKHNSEDLSKATGVHRNTLKLLKEINLVNPILKNSILLNGCLNYKNSNLVNHTIYSQGRLSFDKNVSMSQLQLEKILSKRIRDKIWYKTKLINYKKDRYKIYALVSSEHGSKSIEANYLVGADGTNSVVRNLSNIKYNGISTKELAFTFDAKISNSPLKQNQMYIFDNYGKRLVIVPLPGKNNFKFSGKIVNENLNKDRLKTIVKERANLDIIESTIQGLSFYHTKSYLAEKFVDNNVILIGDAAHSFFPAGGYGLNLAIEDSFALAWRLKHPNVKELLREYNSERRNIAQIFRGDANTKKFNSEIMYFAEKNSKEEQVYHNVKLGNIEFIKLEDKLYEYLYDKIKDKEAFAKYSFKLVTCTNNLKKVDFSKIYNPYYKNLNSVSLHVILSKKCNKRVFYLIRPDLFYCKSKDK